MFEFLLEMINKSAVIFQHIAPRTRVKKSNDRVTRDLNSFIVSVECIYVYVYMHLLHAKT